ncbi:hypothetical protein ATL41_1987 [Flavimobilis soli]|uniref:TadE-like protein n=1 Tax=Flavimobilis soli TaxID=442709 RepID=A0A2A9EEK1_9MICO|nr:TadE family type IV pilus minor pilin [Flavimobilis soli]PFG37233.1 hypothetical protein ATL41_1987 [Flavimobilis soli]
MRRAPRAAGPHGDSGAVTAELAVLLPTVVVLLLVLLVVGSVGMTLLQVAGAARAGARAASLGEDAAAVTSAARRVAGDAAAVRTDGSDGWVTVLVSRGVGTGWLSFDVTGTSTAWVEQ